MNIPDDTNRALREWIASQPEPNDALNEVKKLLHELSPVKTHPVDLVLWVPVDKVQSNDWNPNSVARIEMGLLYVSISHDGYTQPIVTVYDPAADRYTIIDGFHRYYTLKANPDLMESTGGRLPIVVIDKPINERMAATVRHNRARGAHSVQGMSNLVFSMLENGWEDDAICNELGMEPEELLRLKHITGFSKLFENVEYRKAWMTSRQILIKKEYDEAHHASSLSETT